MNPLNPVIKEEILDNADIVIKTEPPDNIKEKLTNHLKRRQRTDDTIHLPNTSTAQIEPPSPLKLVPKKLSKLTTSKKNKIQRSVSNIETMSSSKLHSLSYGGHTTTNNNMSNNGSVNNSNDEEKYGPHDGQTSAATSPTEKSKTPDIITTVLNHKRMSLLQDPDVVRFLENVSKNKRVKTGK